MIFQNPWAWIGLAAVAVPVLVHLLARRPARRQPFPTTRFLPAALMTPVRRGRPSDWWLLVIRSGVFIAAAVALTQPLWLTTTRSGDRNQQLARAIIVDTSDSMRRATASGESGADAAAREARRLAAEATRVRIGETTAPASQIDAAIRWLNTQPMRRELVVVSDFQTGAIGATDLSRTPDDIGRKLVPIPVAGPIASPATNGRSEIRLLAAVNEKADAEAARTAAVSTGASTETRADRPVAVMFPAFEEQQRWLSEAKSPPQPWMFDVARAVTSDPVVRAAAERSDPASAESIRFVRHAIDGVDGLVVVVQAAPHTLSAAAIVAATMRAAADSIAPTESVTTVLSPEDLKSLERTPAERGATGTPTPGHESDGRWFWAAAIVFLVVESVIRRVRKPMEMPHARVA